MLLSFLARRSESRTTCPWWWRCIAPTQPVVIVEIVWFEWWQTHILQKAKWYHIYKRYMQGPDLRHMFKVEKHDSNGPHEEGWYCFIGSCLDSAIYIYISNALSCIGVYCPCIKKIMGPLLKSQPAFEQPLSASFWVAVWGTKKRQAFKHIQS